MPLRSPLQPTLGNPRPYGTLQSNCSVLAAALNRGPAVRPAFLYPFPFSLFVFFFRDDVGVGEVSALWLVRVPGFVCGPAFDPVVLELAWGGFLVSFGRSVCLPSVCLP